MKLYQIEHINMERFNKIAPELVFVSAICPLTGNLRDVNRQPDDWDNVKRLTNMLFLAWDNHNPYEGTVYLGKFQ